jgi:3',5'-cyclic AMP phosphodiesterase CpdA
MLIAQISDCHITTPGAFVADRVDPRPGLDAAIASINRLGEDVALVVGTGDLVNVGVAAEYDQLEAALAALDVPFLAVPGNHDRRGELRRRFDLPDGSDDEPIDHVVDLGAARLICLDTSRPGRHDGDLSEAQLSWLDEQLGADPGRAAVVVQHHPIVSSGLSFMDEPYPLQAADAEAEVIARHPNTVAVWSGHHHRAAQRVVGAALHTVAPSTSVSLAPAFGSPTTRYSDEPCGWLLHDVHVGGCTSRLVVLGATAEWTPSWA